MNVFSLALGNLAVIVIGAVLLWKCGDLVVRYAIEVAEMFNVSTFFLGFVILALAADVPDLAVAFTSAFGGIGEMSVGSVIGGNFTDIALVIGATLLFARGGIIIKKADKKKLLIILWLSGLVIGVFLCIGSINRWYGLGLILLYVASLVWLWKNGDGYDVVHEDIVATTHQTKDVYLTSKIGLISKLLLSGIAIMAVSHATVQCARTLACEMHWLPEKVGAAILGVLNSLPELALSIGALRRGDHGLAIGPTLGTVLGQTTLILGITALFSSSPVSFQGIGSAIIFMFVAFALIIYGLMRDRPMGRGIGAILLSLFALFMGYHIGF